MKDLLASIVILTVGFCAGLAILSCVPHDQEDAPYPRATELNWSQQALRDPAQDGCPGQYHQYAGEFLISCWGQKKLSVVCDWPNCHMEEVTNDAVTDLERAKPKLRSRMGDTRNVHKEQ